LDDAAGEAFDKVAKMLKIGFPGGPNVERWALQGDASRFAFAQPLVGRKGCDFSFSGLKTAVRTCIQHQSALSNQDKSDMCASFQKTAADHMVDRCKRALALCPEKPLHIVVSGGVAANLYIRSRLEDLSNDQGITFIAPPLKLCTDNAAMIAWAGLERFKRGCTSPLHTAPRPRWPLEELR
jgi:N6-L-threonylcarbamoyladenine synthase